MKDTKKVWFVRYWSTWPDGSTRVNQGGVSFKSPKSRDQAAALLVRHGAFNITFPDVEKHGTGVRS